LDALDFFDEEADGLKHAADLAVAAFDEGDFVPGVGSVFVEADFGGRGFYAAVVVEGDVDTGAEASEGLFVGAAADFDEIFFGDVGAGLGEFLGEGAVVGEEEEAFAGVIEAADGIDAFRERAEELHYGGAAFGVADGGDVAFGFVEHEIEEALGGLDRFAVDADGVRVGIAFGAEFGDDLAVEGDAAGGDDLFGFAAGGDAGGGEDFLEALEHEEEDNSEQIAEIRKRVSLLDHFTMRFVGRDKDSAEAQRTRRLRREEKPKAQPGMAVLERGRGLHIGCGR